MYVPNVTNRFQNNEEIATPSRNRLSRVQGNNFLVSFT